MVAGGNHVLELRQLSINIWQVGLGVHYTL